ncbi:MAG: hypothetical protein FVQ83_17045, partial [Chloroflexi bacterium]|nr:hypothetical protein [Chloroflexota bacterium]
MKDNLKQLREIVFRNAAYFWNGPATLPNAVKLEWKLIPIRWFGIVFVSGGLLLANLTPSQFSGAYTILTVAAAYNIILQMILKRQPKALVNGYLTSFADAALSIVMLLVLGGFDSPFYYILYTVTISSVMRYGKRPVLVMLLLLIGADFIEGQFSGQAITASFIIRSTFLVITAVLTSFLRDKTQNEAALQERLAAQEELVRHQRFAVLGEMASGVAHELRNPLSGIANAAYYLKSVLEDADENVKKHLSLISKEVDESDKIITDLLDFARIDTSHHKRTSVEELIDEAMISVSFPAEMKIKSQMFPELLLVDVDAEQIKRVIVNLLLNAIQAMPEGGELIIKTAVEEDHVNISITDTGAGIPP